MENELNPQKPIEASKYKRCIDGTKYNRKWIAQNTTEGGSNVIEIDNLRLLHEIDEDSYLKKDFKNWVKDEKNADINLESSLDQNEKYITNSNNGKENTQFIYFQRVMKVLFIYGQCVGLNPVTGISDHDISKIRFKLCSWRFLYTVLIAILQTLAAGVYVYNLFSSPVSMKSLVISTVSFSCWCTTIIFIRIATKWENLVKEIFSCNLDKYIDPGIIIRCNVSCIVFLILVFADHIFFLIMKISEVLECDISDYNFYEKLVKNIYQLYFEVGVPYNIPITILLQMNNIIIFSNWNFSDVCIISISLYLTSILKEINKKILWAADKNYVPSSLWGTLREDYSRATCLIRLFDDVFSSLVLLRFGTNLFWICLHIYNILENGIRPKHKSFETCRNFGSGPFYGYEHSIRTTFSLTLSVVRFTTLCLVAANVNVASSVPASGLYRVPSCSYSIEVQRFLDQAHDDVVALTGLGYFHITRELVLSVAGTILTYELVLLQFENEELNN